MSRKSSDAAPTDPISPHSASPAPPGDFGAFRPIIFGEALFDHFPDGSRVLGGAPFNVAWHLRGFGSDPLLVTAVGKDPEGEEILDRMGSWDMDTSGVQIHPAKPTGRVTAHLDNGQPTFEIETKQAFDGITIGNLPPSFTSGPMASTRQGHDIPRTQSPRPAAPSLLYFGSLCLREEPSAATLAHLRTSLEGTTPNAPTLVDVNLRDPWWEWERTRGHIRGVEWLKVNDEEVGLLTRRPVTTQKEILEAAENLSADLDIRNVVVTLGSRGAVALSGGARAGERARVEGKHLPNIVDTVGAGDAFTSVLALGIHAGWALTTILQRASTFAAETCLARGATSPDPSLYLRTLREWTHAP